ncbi:MAG: SDR family oxidoreductase [Acidimicrobiales bacterium]|jgi:3-oxoacyl-[acyl-carrier protein] reductase|nr:SDR family oxidoreductase [Acidimicrobiales bacterium]
MSDDVAPDGTGAGTPRRVALIADAGFYVGPALSRLLAGRGHDLVLGDPPAELVAELEAAGATVEPVAGARNLARPEAAPRLVQAALERFGRLDAAVAFSGQIVVGRFTKSTLEDLRTVVAGCLEAPYLFLRATVEAMLPRGEGQILVITSASAARPTPGAPLYSAARAGATHLVRNVAAEIAASGVQVNAVGTNFMDFPEFLVASGAADPQRRQAIEAQVPMGRLGTMEEFASFCLPYLDGTSRFTTGQFTAYAGGWA